MKMPPLSPDRKAVYEYYRLEFMENGYPGKRTKEGVLPHPIYAPYVIADYLSQYQKKRDDAFLDAIDIIIDAACQMMRSDGEALLFDYPRGISSYDAPFASGLTQSRYMEVFRSLWLTTGADRYRKLA
jgi:hypothetical protein